MPKFAAQAAYAKLGVFPVLVSGGIASGKSTLCRELMAVVKSQGLPAHHIDFDQITYMVHNNAEYGTFKVPVEDIMSVERSTRNRVLKEKYREPLLDQYFKYLGDNDIRGIVFVEGSKFAAYDMTWLGFYHILVDASPDTRHESYMKRAVERGITPIAEPTLNELLLSQDTVDEYRVAANIDLYPTYTKDYRTVFVGHHNNDGLNKWTPITDVHTLAASIINNMDIFGDLRLTKTFMDNGLDKTCIMDYNDVHRAYHNVFHVVQGLDVLTYLELAQELNHFSKTRLKDVKLAWALHDIDKETVDALYACNKIEPYIRQLVYATYWDQRRERDMSSTVSLLHDIDFLVFMEDEERYATYAKRIRKEFSGYTDKEFKEGRTNFLNTLLKQSKGDIFCAEYGLFVGANEKAKQNIRRELEALQENC